MDKQDTGYDIVRRIEAHCGEQLSKRMRIQIASSLQDEINRHRALRSKVMAVLDGAGTYDPRRQKPIALSKKEYL